DRTRKQDAKREYVEEGDGAEERVPEPQAELVMRQQAQADRRGDDPELEWGLFEEDVVGVGTEPGIQPIAAREYLVHRERINGFVVLQIRAAEAEEQRNTKSRDDQNQPERPDQSFTHVTSDQILGTFTFSIEIGCSSAWARNAGRSRS